MPPPDMGTIPPAGQASGSTGSFTTLSTSGLATLSSASVTNALTVSQTAGIVGTTTNNNANTGAIGEFVTATVASVGSALSNATPLTIASISLTAGDWDVVTFVNFLETGATGTQLACGPSLTTNVLPTQTGGGGLGTDALSINDAVFTGISGTQQIDSGPIRVSIAGTTSVFMVAQATFSVGTVSAFGTIRARRVR